MTANFMPSLFAPSLFAPSLFAPDSNDPQDLSDDDFNVVGGEIFATFSPWASWQSEGNPFAPVTLLPAVADGSAGGQVDPGSAVAVTSGGITINLIFDTAALAAPASFRAGIQQAVAILAAAISDKITVNLKIDYSGTGGGASAGPDHGLLESYSSIRASLINGATPGDTTFNALTSGTSIQGQSSVAVWNAQLKLWGLMGANDTTTDDGSAKFATDINPNLLVGVALHELTHAMGRIPYGPQPDIFDLFRFTGAGTRLFSSASTASAAYFSLDGGNTKLADYGQKSDPSDFLNTGVQGGSDPFNEFYNGGTSQQLTAADLKQLDALGFHLSAPDSQAPALVSDNPLSLQVGATQAITASLLNATDNLSSGAQLRYTVTAGPAQGTLLLSGSATSSFTQADINSGLVSYHETASGVTSDSFSFKVSDAAGNTTATASFQINIGLNHAPVVTAASANLVATAGQALSASSLFSPSDADGDALSYVIYDNTISAGGGHFMLNGVTEPSDVAVTLSAAQFAQLSFVAGSAGSSSDLNVMAYDGHAYSGWGEVHVNVDHAPVVNLVSGATVAANPGQVLQASSLFSASDADGDALSYVIYDNTISSGGGHFMLNGAAVPSDVGVALSAAQLAQLSFVAGAAGSSSDLNIRAFDGHVYSGWGEVHVNVDHAPVVSLVSGANVSASPGQAVAASSLFSATDLDGDALTYYIYDNTVATSGGHFSISGTPVPSDTMVAVTPAQLAQLVFVAGASGASDDLNVRAYDGHVYTGWSEFHVNANAAGHAPVVTVPSAHVTAAPGQVLQASSLFSATDADGDALTFYLYDNTVATSGGHFAVNGTAVPRDALTPVSAAQLAQTTFVAGAAGSSDDLFVKAYDGHVYTDWSEFHILV
jgi:hypothetical protein